MVAVCPCGGWGTAELDGVGERHPGGERTPGRTSPRRRCRRSRPRRAPPTTAPSRQSRFAGHAPLLGRTGGGGPLRAPSSGPFHHLHHKQSAVGAGGGRPGGPPGAPPVVALGLHHLAVAPAVELDARRGGTARRRRAPDTGWGRCGARTLIARSPGSARSAGTSRKAGWPAPSQACPGQVPGDVVGEHPEGGGDQVGHPVGMAAGPPPDDGGRERLQAAEAPPRGAARRQGLDAVGHAGQAQDAGAALPGRLARPGSGPAAPSPPARRPRGAAPPPGRSRAAPPTRSRPGWSNRVHQAVGPSTQVPANPPTRTAAGGADQPPRVRMSPRVARPPTSSTPPGSATDPARVTRRGPSGESAARHPSRPTWARYPRWATVSALRTTVGRPEGPRAAMRLPEKRGRASPAVDEGRHRAGLARHVAVRSGRQAPAGIGHAGRPALLGGPVDGQRSAVPASLRWAWTTTSDGAHQGGGVAAPSRTRWGRRRPEDVVLPAGRLALGGVDDHQRARPGPGGRSRASGPTGSRPPPRPRSPLASTVSRRVARPGGRGQRSEARHVGRQGTRHPVEAGSGQQAGAGLAGAPEPSGPPAPRGSPGGVAVVPDHRATGTRSVASLPASQRLTWARATSAPVTA